MWIFKNNSSFLKKDTFTIRKLFVNSITLKYNLAKSKINFLEKLKFLKQVKEEKR